jgi:hypothetical protein
LVDNVPQTRTENNANPRPLMPSRIQMLRSLLSL